MDSPSKHGEPVRASSLQAKHLTSSARDFKIHATDENLGTQNQPRGHPPSQFKPGRPNFKEDPVAAQTPSTKPNGKAKIQRVSMTEVNYMQFYKGTKEFRLLSEGARAALLDDLCELDQCHHLSQNSFSPEAFTDKGELTSREEKAPLRVHLQPRQQAEAHDRGHQRQPVGVRGPLPHGEPGEAEAHPAGDSADRHRAGGLTRACRRTTARWSGSSRSATC